MHPHCLLALAFAFLVASPAAAKELVPEQRVRASSDFSGAKPGKPARDVSGLACMPVSNGQRRCLLINDEGAFAQFATLAERGLEPGAKLEVLGTGASPATLGRPPENICKSPGRFAELDGEAVAYADGAFYIAGSHGCSRRKGEFRLSSFHLGRLAVDATGRPSGEVTLTYRLADMLRMAGPAAPAFGRGLMDENGMNIEGIAVIGDTLWAGLRAPSLDGKAFLVGASLDALFASGPAPATTPPRMLAIPAGRDRGIRDLAALTDGRLLALVGPAQEQALPYAILLVDPTRPDAAVTLGELPSRGEGKAESLTVLDQAGGRLHLLVGYDGRRNGGFEDYRLALP